MLSAFLQAGQSLDKSFFLPRKLENIQGGGRCSWCKEEFRTKTVFIVHRNMTSGFLRRADGAKDCRDDGKIWSWVKVKLRDKNLRGWDLDLVVIKTRQKKNKRE